MPFSVKSSRGVSTDYIHKVLINHYSGLSDEMFATCTRDCGFKKEKKTGVYTMFQNTSKLFHVMCDMETDGGNWTVSYFSLSSIL